MQHLAAATQCRSCDVTLSDRGAANPGVRRGGGRGAGATPDIPMSGVDSVWKHHTAQLTRAAHAVFGDGDPNADYEARRWAMVGQLIQSRGGVVAAEELAPYLDVTPEALAASREGAFVDEGYVVPALVRFGGQPEVGPDGELLYRFPSLQRTARAQVHTCVPMYRDQRTVHRNAGAKPSGCCFTHFATFLLQMLHASRCCMRTAVQERR